MKDFKETSLILLDSFSKYKNRYTKSKNTLAIDVQKKEEKVIAEFEPLLDQFNLSKFPFNKSELYKIFNFIEHNSQTKMGKHLMESCFHIFECPLPKMKTVYPPIKRLTTRLSSAFIYIIEINQYKKEMSDNYLEYKAQVRKQFQLLLTNFDNKLTVSLYGMFSLKLNHDFPLEIAAIVNSYACDILHSPAEAKL